MRFKSLALAATVAGLAAGCGDGDGGGVELVRGPPGAPADVFANPTIGGADVGWQANPEHDVVAYDVTASAEGQGSRTVRVVPPATGTRLTGLAAGVSYTVQVVAVDSQNLESSLSAPASVVVPRASTAAEILAYESAATYSQNINGEGLLILRDGQIVHETYTDSYGPEVWHALASGTKSFSCALLLAAQQDGMLDTETRLADTLTEWQADANKSRITVRQLLSLQGGLSLNPEYSPENVASLDTYELALEDPAAHPPGAAFIYDPLAFQAFALFFERRANGRKPVEYLQEKLFDPLGITAFFWQVDREGHPQMAGGAAMTARAWARYGQLMLQNGTWGSQRLLPAAGVRDCLSYRNDAYLGYGITWWLNRPVEDSYDPSIDQVPEDGIAGFSGQIAPSAGEDMVMAAGVGGQRLYLLPQYRTVVVRFASGNTTMLRRYSDEAFLRRLLGLAVGE